MENRILGKCLQSLRQLILKRKRTSENHRRTLQTNRAAESGKRFFIKKVRTTLTKKERLKMIERKALISIRRQCELLGVSRKTFYYKPKVEDRFNQKLMELIEAYYFRDPTSGSRKITVYLRREGYKVNRKRVQRLMKGAKRDLSSEENYKIR